jgi:hypothetical protein
MIALLFGEKNAFLSLIDAPCCWIISETEGGHGLTSFLAATVVSAKERLSELQKQGEEIEWKKMNSHEQDMLDRRIAVDWKSLAGRIMIVEMPVGFKSTIRFERYPPHIFPLTGGKIRGSGDIGVSQPFCTLPRAFAEVVRMVRKGAGAYEGVNVLQDMIRDRLSLDNAELRRRFTVLPENLRMSCVQDMALLNEGPEDFYRAMADEESGES